MHRSDASTYLRKWNARQAERIVQQIEREERHEPDERDEPPTFGIHTGHETLEPAGGWIDGAAVRAAPTAPSL
jgi:hypothetical protein